jgi:hypothetical protein
MFEIAGGDYIYTVYARLHWGSFSHRLLLTVGGPVQYAIEGRMLVFIDDEGKQRNLKIIRRALRKSNPTE